jgi:hypothetical protein
MVERQFPWNAKRLGGHGPVAGPWPWPLRSTGREVRVRTRLSVRVPAETSPQQLLAVASLVVTIGAGSWPDLARSFRRMADVGAEIAPEMRDLLTDLGAQLRTVARERELLDQAPL